MTAESGNDSSDGFLMLQVMFIDSALHSTESTAQLSTAQYAELKSYPAF